MIHYSTCVAGRIGISFSIVVVTMHTHSVMLHLTSRVIKQELLQEDLGSYIDIGTRVCVHYSLFQWVCSSCRP